MDTVLLPRPEAHEAAPYYHAYIAEVTDGQISTRLDEQVAEVAALTGALDDRAAMARYAPGKWSIKEVLGHLSDAERVFSYRLWRISRGDDTPLAGFEEDAYVAAAGFDARSLAELVAEFTAVRRATLTLVAGVRPEAWANVGSANGAAVSARALVYIVVGHAAHHLRVLRERYGLGAGGKRPN